MKLPDDFPSFANWDIEKVNFLNSRSVKQCAVQEKNENFVIVDDRISMDVKLCCKYCGEKLTMFFNLDIEEWVFAKAKNLNGFPVHEDCHTDALKRYPDKQFDEELFMYTSHFS